ncbi:dapper homolog 2 [Boleophthalmus pectinirostris]|uniref:dapper homolog 2 n=1 Tax=Boleophthalmus pectinirostris TaxID=150288 RepID=UPI00242B9089|nr:dapper homolog 2 [Boleophthalmus pectinirostris]
MLSRKGSNAGMMAVAPAGVDRSRVGERLHAALAGLQELHLLRDRQSEMVSWALRADREEPVTSVHHSPEDPRVMGAEEQRLEATLTALKQQLSRLRKQDVGLKTHLQQLDQQINELKLDVNKADQQETDSRPSSGFYELSDGGSGSLSNSCTSVYSACLSSPQTTLPANPSNIHNEPQNQADVSRRRSADESTAQTTAPRVKGGLHLGSSRIRANTEKARPRPVSTGDLDRMMGQMQNYSKPVDTSKPIASQNIQMDSKFHSNLVSRTGAEMYQYPSPLHAVALQSPIFSPNCETPNNGLLEGPLVNGSSSLQRPANYDTKTFGYIDKILQRSFSKLSFESGSDTLSSQHSHRKPSEVVTVFPEVSQKEVSALPPLPPPPAPAPTAPQITNVPAQGNDQKRHYPGQETADNTNKYKQLLRPHEVSHRLSFPADTREYSSDEVTTSTLKKVNKLPMQYSSLSRSHSDYRSSDNTEPRHDRKGQKQRSVISQSSSTEEGHSFEAPHSTSPQFVHAQFVPAGSQRVKVRQADRKTKNVKLKKKNVEKPRKQQHGYSSGEKSKDSSNSKSDHKKSSKGKITQKSPVYLSDEHRRGSGSDSSHCSAGLMYTQKIHAKPQPNAAVGKSTKNHRKPQNMEYEVDQRKKRQGDRQVDICQAQMSYRQRSREAPIPNMHMVRSVSSRTGQWVQQPQRHFPTSMSVNSFHQNLNARYPAAPYHITSRYPPRCESEYSAECASLFHSTIAASSDGEMSDHTTNRFGDSESSQSYQSFSDSDSSLSFDEEEDFLDEDGSLVWANAAMGPTTAGRPVQQQQQAPPPRSAPSSCRIKASRALKKKIRRFQPASLKVMTLV